MNEKVILVVCGTFREFQHGCLEKIRAEKDPAVTLHPTRMKLNDTQYLYMPEPDSMRGIQNVDEVQYWGTYHRRPQRELELFRIIGNSRINRKEKA